MVEDAYPGRGKEANTQNQQILDTVALAAGLGDTPLMICGDLQHEPRRQSRHLDFALSQGWLTDLGQTRKPVGATQPLHTYEQGDTKTRLDFALVNEAFRAKAHPQPRPPRTQSVHGETPHGSECGRPATPRTHLPEQMETSESRVRTANHGSKEQQSAMEQNRGNEQSLASDHGHLCEFGADTNDLHAVQGQSSEVLPDHSGWLHQARKDW